MSRVARPGSSAAANAIWRFREAPVQAGAVEKLFARFNAHLKDAGYLAMGGQIVDASIIAAPRQRVTDEERAIVRGPVSASCAY